MKKELWDNGSEKEKRLKKWVIGKPSEWFIKQAKKHGHDIEYKNHVITNDFKNHVIKKHGNPKSEEPQGQLAVNEDDFRNLPEVVKNPDKIIVGVLSKKGTKMLHYLKKYNKGTILYAEEEINNKKELRGKTMIIRKKDVNDKLFDYFASCKGKNDMTNKKIIAPIDAGDYPGYAENSEAVVNSAVPIGQLQGYPLTDNIHQIPVEIKRRNK